MKSSGALLIGLVVGVVLGIGGARFLDDGIAPPPPPERSEEPSHERCRAREQSLRLEVESLRRQNSTAAHTPAPPAGSAIDSAAPPTPETAFRAAVTEVRGRLAAIETAEPGSEAVLSLMQEWRAVLDTEDDRMRRLAAWVLKHLAATGKLRPGDVDGFVAEYRALPAGARARPGLAAAVTRSFAEDARLADWLRDLPSVEEPEVREAAVWALDESPSAALRDYLLKLSREETSADVLNSIWNEDIILVCLTRDSAPKLIEAIGGRVARGDLPPKVRGRAHFAIGLAAAHSPGEARAAIEGLLASESDPGVLAFGEDVVAAIEREESNVQALEGLWNRHAPEFGE